MASFAVRLFILLGILGFSFWLRFSTETGPGSFETALAPKRAALPDAPALPGGIDVNLATREALVSLPGIGPKRADAIILERETNGAFRSMEDLLRVPGIGPVTLKNIAPHLRISPVTEAAHEPPKQR